VWASSSIKAAPVNRKLQCIAFATVCMEAPRANALDQAAAHTHTNRRKWFFACDMSRDELYIGSIQRVANISH
jgi:hypothetical protein